MNLIALQLDELSQYFHQIVHILFRRIQSQRKSQRRL